MANWQAERRNPVIRQSPYVPQLTLAQTALDTHQNWHGPQNKHRAALQMRPGSADVSTAVAAIWVTGTLTLTPLVNKFEGTERKCLVHSFKIFLYVLILKLRVQFGL